jgi:hypothetical protein
VSTVQVFELAEISHVTSASTLPVFLMRNKKFCVLLAPPVKRLKSKLVIACVSASL